METRGTTVDGIGTTTQLLLIRHGESTWNAEGRIGGQADPPLSELGRRQAAALGHRLSKLAALALYTSPATRTRETSEAIAEYHDLTPQIEPALLEVNLGSWQGLRESELSDDDKTRYRNWEFDPSTISPPGGESILAALERVSPALKRIFEDHRGGTVLVVTHSIIGRVALSHLLGTDVRLVPRLRVKKASITKLRLQNGIVILERLSDTGHLRSLY
jgi:phosphoserine phosphatase